MSAKHTPGYEVTRTPGPWHVTDENRARRVIKGADEGRAGRTVTGRTVCIIEDWTTEPDALLIAAAPDLAQACVEMLEMLDAMRCDGGVQEFARAALQKAGLR